jgi:hypothetical protein
MSPSRVNTRPSPWPTAPDADESATEPRKIPEVELTVAGPNGTSEIPIHSPCGSDVPVTFARMVEEAYESAVWKVNVAVVVCVVPGSVKIAKVPAFMSELITNAEAVPTVTVGGPVRGVLVEVTVS